MSPFKLRRAAVGQITKLPYSLSCIALVVLAGCFSEEAATVGSTAVESTASLSVNGQCTSALGNAISGGFGRLDGTVFALVPAKTHVCNSDSSHLHVQIQSNGAVYDAAVNLDGQSLSLSAPLKAGAWSEGWHGASSLDYVRDLSVHSNLFRPTSETALERELNVGQRVSVFMSPFSHSGGHLIHRGHSGGHDGAIVIDADTSSPKYLLFTFTQLSF